VSPDYDAALDAAWHAYQVDAVDTCACGETVLPGVRWCSGCARDAAEEAEREDAERDELDAQMSVMDELDESPLGVP
jgi:hypothetical protein